MRLGTLADLALDLHPHLEELKEEIRHYQSCYPRSPTRQYKYLRVGGWVHPKKECDWSAGDSNVHAFDRQPVAKSNALDLSGGHAPAYDDIFSYISRNQSYDHFASAAKPSAIVFGIPSPD